MINNVLKGLLLLQIVTLLAVSGDNERAFRASVDVKDIFSDQVGLERDAGLLAEMCLHFDSSFI